jgi:hypothetical protein
MPTSLDITGLAYIGSPRAFDIIACSSACCLACACAFAAAADSGRNCLKSPRRSGAVLKR